MPGRDPKDPDSKQQLNQAKPQPDLKPVEKKAEQKEQQNKAPEKKEKDDEEKFFRH